VIRILLELSQLTAEEVILTLQIMFLTGRTIMRWILKKNLKKNKMLKIKEMIPIL